MSPATVAEFQSEIGARMGRGDFAGAQAAAAICRAEWPSHSAGWLLGSIAALLADEKETAYALIDACLIANPRDVQCLIQKAECLMALGRRTDASLAAAAAGDCAGSNPAALDAVGEFLVLAREHPRALEIYERAVAAAPCDASILAKRAAVHTYLGHFDRAEADFARLLAISPFDAEALRAAADLRRQTRDANRIDAMQAALAAAPPGGDDAVRLNFGLAKSYEDLGEYESSWRHLEAGNRIERARIQYHAETDRLAIEAIVRAFPAAEAADRDGTSDSPIFIVGLPRTGTTLVERILGSHSAVYSAGELSALSEAIGCCIDRASALKPRDWIEYAGVLGELDGASLRREYLLRSQARRGDRPRFSDKQPLNFLYCGLIFRAFPNARIVHLTRHPLATCYAIYKTLFGGTYPFAYDLAELGEFYLNYRKLMTHWHRVLPGRILDVAYEDVVTAQRATTERMLAYLDLPFEQGCLDFHLNPAPVATASTVQVRQRLYDSSLNQWQNHAAPLEPLRARFQSAGIRID
jgi:tetratricopeptide (TPR) repeat protein